MHIHARSQVQQSEVLQSAVSQSTVSLGDKNRFPKTEVPSERQQLLPKDNTCSRLKDKRCFWRTNSVLKQSCFSKTELASKKTTYASPKTTTCSWKTTRGLKCKIVSKSINVHVYLHILCATSFSIYDPCVAMLLRMSVWSSSYAIVGHSFVFSSTSHSLEWYGWDIYGTALALPCFLRCQFDPLDLPLWGMGLSARDSGAMPFGLEQLDLSNPCLHHSKSDHRNSTGQ